MDIRLFLAFELPQEIREIIDEVSKEAVKLPLNVRWVRTENIHLTVVFLGNVQESLVSRVEEVACLASSRSHPLDITLRSLGFFGNIRNPRVLWIGMNGDVKGMSCLRDELQKGLIPFGVKEGNTAVQAPPDPRAVQKRGGLRGAPERIARTIPRADKSVGSTERAHAVQKRLEKGGSSLHKDKPVVAWGI